MKINSQYTFKNIKFYLQNIYFLKINQNIKIKLKKSRNIKVYLYPLY